MTRLTILSKGQAIGETELEMQDPGMNIHSGRFYPVQGYEHVRPVFRSLSRILDLSGDEQRQAFNDYYGVRDDLDLSIQYADGRSLSTNWINIIDIEDDLTSFEDLRVEVALSETLSVPEKGV